MKELTRHYAYVLPGLPIAVFSFGLLLGLTVLSIATVVIWIGALLMPLTLIAASGFAELDRSRLRRWGAAVTPVQYMRTGPKLTDKLRLTLDPRRWLDLVFAMLLALPLRLVTFTVALTWTLGGPGGVTYFFWSVFVPGDGSATQLLELSNPQLAPETGLTRYLLDSGVHFALGVVLLLSLPAVMRGLAGLDAMVSTALLSGEARGQDFGRSPGHTHNDDGGHGRSGRFSRAADQPGDSTVAGSNSDGPSTPGSSPGSSHAEDSSSTSAAPAGISLSSASFSSAAWSWLGAGFAAVVLLAVGWPVIAAVYSVNAAIAMVVVASHCAAVVLTIRWVWPGLVLSLVASAATMAATADAEVAVWPWPVTAMLTQSAVLVVAALRRPWFHAVAAWCAAAVITVAALLVVGAPLPGGALASSVVFVAVSAAVVLIGALIRLWIRNAGQLQEATRTSAEQGRRRHELEERNRIARELHDVVAHSMSVISVQAATAQYRNPHIDDAARTEFDEIAGSSRQALSEMRMLLSILRGDDAVPTAPEPGLADISTLVESTRVSGIAISFSDEGEQLAAVPVSDATGLAAYRTVQEGLSNALRHAPGAAISVKIEVGETTTSSAVPAAEGAGRPAESLAEGAQPRPVLHIAVCNAPPPQKTSDRAPGAGFGLQGIRERVSAAGGFINAAPTSDGGFALRATLPV